MALNSFDDKRLYINNIQSVYLGIFIPKKVIVLVYCVLNLLDSTTKN